jgi:hypothetical protein
MTEPISIAAPKDRDALRFRLAMLGALLAASARLNMHPTVSLDLLDSLEAAYRAAPDTEERAP